MVVPAVHKLRADVAELFGKTIGTDPKEQRHSLSRRKPAHEHVAVFRAREDSRHDGLQFRGGGNGHGRCVHERGQCGPVGECAATVHIASIGIEKIIPTIADLGVFVRMLSRSALGSPITQYDLALSRAASGHGDALHPRR